MRRRGTALFVTITGTTLMLTAAACGSSSSGGTTSSGSSSTPSSSTASSPSSASAAPALCGGSKGSGKVVVGAAAFSENETLAAIYAAALNECGYTATTKTFNSREVYYPALKKGQIQVVPEYAATLTDFINQAANGAKAPTKASGDITKTVTALKGELPSTLGVLDPASATDKNAFAVTKKFASAHNITTTSQLAAYSKAHPVKLGGPAECPTRPFCEPGLKKTYGMKISSFSSLDAGGPLTIKAIKSGKVDVGLVFTSDATVAANNLQVLTDDKQLQASDNIIPLVASSLASGPAASALNAVDSKLDETTLVSINKAVGIDRAQPSQVATQFLSQEGLSS